MATQTVEQKVGQWKVAFDAILAEQEAAFPGMRELVRTLQSDQAMRDLPLYIQLARIINANDRCAATTAALLVQSGIKPVALNFGDDE